MRFFGLFIFAVTAAVAASVTGGVGAHAEVKKFAYLCGSQQGTPQGTPQICAYYRIVLTPPDGWIVEETASKQSKLQMLVPKGKNFATAPALIYVQVFYHHDKQQSLDDFAKVNNERWLANLPNAKITPLPAVQRTNGKAGFLRFAFENPGHTQQACELGAFGIDTDTDGNEFVLDVVMTGSNKAAPKAAEKDYIAFLKAH
jgi:hypothetical protein